MSKPIQKILVVPKGGSVVGGTREKFFYPDTGHLSKVDYKALTQTLDLLEKNLVKNDFDYSIVLKPDKDMVSRFDLVITVGGDGTFLRAAHKVDDVPMLGINSNPRVSIGALLGLKPQGVAKKLKSLKKGNYKTLVRHRIGIFVNGKEIPVSPLNDVLFANQSPAAMSRYAMMVGGKKENQRSSGIWIATPSGSTAAIKAAGGKKAKIADQKLQYLVREPYKGLGEKTYKILKGFLKPGESLEFVNEMHRAGLFLDGTQAHFVLAYGDKIRVQVSNRPLVTIV